MSRYLTVVFADLEQHSTAWGTFPRDAMVGVVAEYRYRAEGLAGQYGSLYTEWAGDGHMFLYESADVAVQFGLRLIDRWSHTRGEMAPNVPSIPLRVGAHFGECTPMDNGHGWIGRSNAVAKRVESEAQPDSLFVTQNVLDLLDLPLYRFEFVGERELKGDVLPSRNLYWMVDFDDAELDSRPDEELSDEDWFLRGAKLIGTDKENSDFEADCYGQAIRLRPDFPEAHLNLGAILYCRGDGRGAARHYQEALRLRPDYPEAHNNYAALLAARGSTSGALSHFRDALAARPDYVDAHHGLANLLRAEGSLLEAEEHYREVLRLRPEYPEAHNDYAVLLEELERAEEASAQYRRALRIRSDYAEAHYNYAMLLESRGQDEFAEDHYLQALQVWPDYPEAHNNLAVLLHLRGDLAQAEQHYREALRLRPDDPEAHYNYGLLLRSRGEEEEAERRFRIATELAPSESRFRSAIEPPS